VVLVGALGVLARRVLGLGAVVSGVVAVGVGALASRSPTTWGHTAIRHIRAGVTSLGRPLRARPVFSAARFFRFGMPLLRPRTQRRVYDVSVLILKG
jgi:hypothetical protein